MTMTQNEILIATAKAVVNTVPQDFRFNEAKIWFYRDPLIIGRYVVRQLRRAGFTPAAALKAAVLARRAGVYNY